MAKYRMRLFAAAAVTASMVLAACGGDGETSTNEQGGEAEAGGTLYYLQHFPFEATDPQRIYYGVQLANFKRTVYRSLVTMPISDDPEVASTPVPDLATDTGTSSDGGATWEFTIKDGVTWEDGSEITCEDFRYGASRTFANDIITGGPNYILSYLDVPQKDGVPTYPGPYKATPAQQAEFDKAIECDGKTITYHFNKPWADFPLAVASLTMMDPYKEELDKGAKSQWTLFSNGPYKLEGGTWSKNKGGTLVRNENYDPATDDPENTRRALPDTIEVQVDPSETSTEIINDRLIADSGNDQYAVTSSRVPPSHFAKLQGAVLDRYLQVESPYVDYLFLNHKTVKDVAVRKAIAVATDLNGYITAIGGEKAGVAAESIINPSLPGYEENPAFAEDNDNDGDPEAAKAILEEAGIKTPYPLTVTYQSDPTYDKAFAVLKESWDEAGFKVTFDPLTDTYYDVISLPDKKADVGWNGWGADWPSAMTVLPALFDSRPNFSPTSCGQNNGCYQSEAFEAKIDEAANAADLDEQAAKLTEADAIMGEEYAYVPLNITVFNWLRGSKVTGFNTTPASSEYPDLGQIGVEQ